MLPFLLSSICIRILISNFHFHRFDDAMILHFLAQKSSAWSTSTGLFYLFLPASLTQFICIHSCRNATRVIAIIIINVLVIQHHRSMRFHTLFEWTKDWRINRMSHRIYTNIDDSLYISLLYLYQVANDLMNLLNSAKLRCSFRARCLLGFWFTKIDLSRGTSVLNHDIP